MLTITQIAEETIDALKALAPEDDRYFNRRLSEAILTESLYYYIVAGDGDDLASVEEWRINEVAHQLAWSYGSVQYIARTDSFIEINIKLFEPYWKRRK